jgi:hypothetical protein
VGLLLLLSVMGGIATYHVVGLLNPTS